MNLKLIKTALFLTTLTLSTVSAGDTYNFSFSKPKAKPKAEQPKKKAAAPAESKPAAPVLEIVEAPKEAAVAKPPVAEETSRPFIRLGFGVDYFFTLPGHAVCSSTSSSSSSCARDKYSSAGGGLTLNFSPSTVIGFSLFLGATTTSNAYSYTYSSGTSYYPAETGVYGGIEVEVNPFGREKKIYLPIEFNFIAGLNSLGRDGSGPLHVGGRLNWNLSQTFGLSMVIRAGTSVQGINFGFITRL